jgi:hypothetical protein
VNLSVSSPLSYVRAPQIGRLESCNPFKRDGVRGCEPSSKGAGPICCNLFKQKEHNDR